MIFLDPIFFISIFLVLPLYYYVKTTRLRNIILLGFSLFWYVFYAKETSIYLFVTIATTYLYGIIFEMGFVGFADLLGIGVNLLILLVLKYNGLFIEGGLNLLIPIGLSFYTFQAIAYCLDVRNKTEKRKKSIVNHALFLGFIPQMVTGPISRKNFLGAEISKEKQFSYEKIVVSIYRIVWGFFKKLVIADNVAVLIDAIYGNYERVSGLVLFANALFYVMRLYLDFSGCMDIAIGIAGLFSIRLPENFNRPFESTSVSEFWRRWHITLGNFARDYVFYPVLLFLTRNFKKCEKFLGKKRVKRIATNISLIVLWTVMGFWHGADLKFFIGNGMLYAFTVILGELMEKPLKRVFSYLRINTESRGYILFKKLRTFLIFAVGNIFFSLESTKKAVDVIIRIFKYPLYNLGDVSYFTSLLGNEKLKVAIGLVFMLVFLIIVRLNLKISEAIRKKSFIVRWISYILMFMLLYMSFVLQNGGYGNVNNFIYMKF